MGLERVRKRPSATLDQQLRPRTAQAGGDGERDGGGSAEDARRSQARWLRAGLRVWRGSSQ